LPLLKFQPSYIFQVYSLGINFHSELQDTCIRSHDWCLEHFDTLIYDIMLPGRWLSKFKATNCLRLRDRNTGDSMFLRELR